MGIDGVLMGYYLLTIFFGFIPLVNPSGNIQNGKSIIYGIH